MPNDELVLYAPGPRGTKNYSILVANGPICYSGMGFASGTSCFPLNIKSEGMFSGELESNITDSSAEYFGLSKDELFYYVYGLLHSTEYQEKYDAELHKILPRLPLVSEKEKYVEVGRKLADLHLNYENQPSYEGVQVNISDVNGSYRVKKMKHPKKGVLDTIVYNENITITNIPEQAYEYVVNGRPAIEWIIDQYQVKTEKKSGITDDPNEFSDDPKYILNLLLSVITVSMKTIDLVGQLPKFEVVDDSQTHRDEIYPLGNDGDLPMVAEKSFEIK
ncbi:type ISP restriction/modification enzyme [Peribacillus frigoritolerans]|uniref:type ISP restriction/modification enzyme n=1 Tax=Peribacillus frigoritolerans TaxID=450367 RepID=UPI003D2E6D38